MQFTQPALPLTQRNANSLHHLQRWLMRLGWLAFFCFVVSIYVVNAPLLWRATYGMWIVESARPAVAEVMGFATYVSLVALLKHVTVWVNLVVALLIVWRRPNDRAALLISAALLWFAIANGVAFGLSDEDVRYPRWIARLLPELPRYTISLDLISLLIPFYLFPNGRFAPTWLRWVFGFSLLSVAVAWLMGEDALFGALVLSISISLPCAVWGQIVRYRRVSTDVERQQTKWVLYGLGVTAFYWCLSAVFFFTTKAPWQFAIDTPLGFLVNLLLPLTMGASILRHRLWDVERVISRTLVYGALSTLVIGCYALIVGLAGALTQSADNLLLSILATGLIAILFQPLRQRMQTMVNRMLYGERDDPVTVLERLSHRLAQTTSPDAMLTSLVETVAHTLKLPYVALVTGDVNSIMASYGSRAALDDEWLDRWPLSHQGETIGQLQIARRGRGESFARHEQRLLQEVAHRAGATVHAAQLDVELQRSRQQQVSGREEERRRLRRDLHDGLGPQLASQALTIDAIVKLLERDPAKAASLLQDLKQQSQSAIRDIRRLVYGLRPPALDDLGLVAALRESSHGHAQSGVAITVDAPDALPPLPAAVEVAVYRIVQEALTNVVRHAHATRCDVRLSIEGTNLVLEVVDDGVGLPAELRSGVGMHSMAERAAELGGQTLFTSANGSGSRVFVSLPVAEADA